MDYFELGLKKLRSEHMIDEGTLDRRKGAKHAERDLKDPDVTGKDRDRAAKASEEMNKSVSNTRAAFHEAPDTITDQLCEKADQLTRLTHKKNLMGQQRLLY